MYKLLIRPILFLFDPEKVHYATFSLIRNLCKIPGCSKILKTTYTVKNKKLERQLFGLTFKNPVGLAAGFDKDAKLHNELSNFGFGFIEIGTLTPKPQEGNPKKTTVSITRRFSDYQSHGIQQWRSIPSCRTT